jgi:Circularly permutated YpsA SLOG family
MPLRVVSGGQTGVDRAALDAALELGIPHGGWCPRGRRSEDGAIPDVYELTETPESRYEQRTEWNVRDADATLLLFRDEMSGGTAFTFQCVRNLGRSHALIDLGRAPDPLALTGWIRGFRVLNVAGPRESRQPGIYEEARQYLLDLLGQARQVG